MKAQFFGDLIPIFGRVRTYELEDGATVKVLCRMISEGIQGRPGHIGDYEISRDELTILLNGRNIATLDGLETKIGEGDTVILLPPFVGG